MNRRFLVIFYACLLIFIATGCSQTAENTQRENELNADWTTEMQFKKPLNFDEIINRCTNIVVGRAISCAYFDNGTYVFKLQPSENIIGSLSEPEIHIYNSDKSTFTMGTNYILFLEAYESALYPHVIYTNYQNTVLQLAQDDTVDFLKYGINSVNEELKNKAEVISYIKNKHQGITRGILNSNLIKSSDINQLVTNSEFIASITPTEIEFKNQLVQMVRCKVVTNLKNRLKDEILILLPAKAELNKEYIVLLNSADDGTYTISSKYSFISKEEGESVNKLLKAIEYNKIK